MNLPKQIKGIEVFYDGRCGMCCSFHEQTSLNDLDRAEGASKFSSSK